MVDRTMRVLEFEKILARLSGYAVSQMGKDRIGALIPSTKEQEVRAWQAETEEARTALAYLGQYPVNEFQDVRAPLKLAKAGGMLSPRMLLDVASCMRAARSTKNTLTNEKISAPLISGMAQSLYTNRDQEEEIFAAILSEDEIADRASPELYSIRRHLNRLQERVREKLNSFLHNPAFLKHLQDPIITVRNGRNVIPVKQESRGAIPGLVHDQSSSGATLFIEPMVVVELSNEVKQWQAKEKQEIDRILLALSAALAPDADLLSANLSVLAQLDMAFAKAVLSREMRAVEPKLNNRGYIKLIRARHPLIDPKTVVPLSIHLGDTFTALVITGPNTGGKTVTLKTVGLLTLMMQAGLHVPAELGTELAIFDNVFADIGDEQSIEQSLSTFSSHMTNIVSILRDVTPNSLALFDELGAGTDPTEGAALAISILERLRERGVRTLATTHYSELKAYALSTEGIENASVEFNVETLRPTYRLSVGIPGKSNAFEISRKLGLAEEIIRDASERLSHDQLRFEDVIANAEYHRQIAEKERALAEEAHREMQSLRNAAEKQRQELETQRESMLKKAKEDARKVYQRAQQEAQEVIGELKRSRSGTALKEHEMQNLKKRLQDGADEMRGGIAPKAQDDSGPPQDLKVGDEVEVLHLGVKGVVSAPPDSKQEVAVQAGPLKLNVHITSLRRSRSAEPKKKSKPRSQTVIAPRQTSMECDVRGMTLDEALMVVDQFLDGAALSNQSIISIIHGKGTGVLRSGIQTHLKRHPHVAEHRLGRYGEGEDGVTVVTLK